MWLSEEELERLPTDGEIKRGSLRWLRKSDDGASVGRSHAVVLRLGEM